MLCGWIAPLKSPLAVSAPEARVVLTLSGFDCNDEGTLVWALTATDVLNPMNRTQFLKLCDSTGGGLCVHTQQARPFALGDRDDVVRLHSMTLDEYRHHIKPTPIKTVDLYACLSQLGCIAKDVTFLPTALTKPSRLERKAEERHAKKLARKLDTPSVKPRPDRTQ